MMNIEKGTLVIIHGKEMSDGIRSAPFLEIIASQDIKLDRQWHLTRLNRLSFILVVSIDIRPRFPR